MTPKIAIIGAGPGGCMLARLLHRRQIPCIIFEGEKAANYRSQGGTLDLRAKTGLAAVEEAGLMPEFLKLARYDGEAMLLCDKDMTTWMKRSPSAQGEKHAIHQAPEIDRAQLRQLLMESLPEGIVRWGHRLLRVDPDLSLHFENGQIESGFDLIVGADGAWSKTRAFVSSAKPDYSGLGGFSMSIPDAEHTAPEVYKLANRGSMFAYSDGKMLGVQQLGDGSLNVSYYGNHDEQFPQTCGYDTNNLESAKKALKEQLPAWSPQLLDIVDKTAGDVLWRNLYMLKPGFRWQHKKGITLLGDAAHLMTPFAGIGVNTAFYDAMLLSHAIAEAEKNPEPTHLDAQVMAYEGKMWENAKTAAELTLGAMNDMMFTPGAPRTSIESYIKRFGRQDMPSWQYPLLAGAVNTGFFFYKLFT
ncbi:hypothetical protein BCR34DRAFT_205503 [Clohesyomyces aquaticus]|uniref:FAD-binding domain-containing protein n=1 Tax=Clohesyomyces aquaticus TaxID=1231657 RepID=A0A1Y1YA40_9PLEO|nr:hypothetical protein BCR34DRAFT_205503 [Clohesyomyces aquaticus]